MQFIVGNEYKCKDKHGQIRHRKITKIDNASYIPPEDQRIYFTDNTGGQASMSIPTFIRQVIHG